MPIEIDSIPRALVYEEDAGKPIYYRGYKKVLTGQSTLEEIMGSSVLQSHLVSQLFLFLSQRLDLQQYQILISELGLQLDTKSTRSCDLAVYEKETFKTLTDEKKYASVPPKIIFEVDLKAALEDSNPQGYINQKIQQLLDWGVEKVCWIETDSRKVLVATPNAPWLIVNWTDEIELLEGLKLTLSTLLEEV
jgi:Uma2 family endonuclease